MIARRAGLLLLLGLSWLASRVLRGPATRRAPGGSPSTGGRMVRDRVCNTFLPRSSALVARDGDEERFFCSEACRGTFLERSR